MQHAIAPNWRMWLLAAGLTDIDAKHGQRFSEDNLVVVRRARGGAGGRAVAAAELRVGLLVHPLGAPASQGEGYCYYVVYPEANASRPNVRAFTDWVLEEAKQTESA